MKISKIYLKWERTIKFSREGYDLFLFKNIVVWSRAVNFNKLYTSYCKYFFKNQILTCKLISQQNSYFKNLLMQKSKNFWIDLFAKIQDNGSLNY